jgi:hypothetical protein
MNSAQYQSHDLQFVIRETEHTVQSPWYRMAGTLFSGYCQCVIVDANSMMETLVAVGYICCSALHSTTAFVSW